MKAISNKFIALGVIIVIAGALFLLIRTEKKVQFEKNQETLPAEKEILPENNIFKESEQELEKSEKNNNASENDPQVKKTEEANKEENKSKIIDRLVSWGFQKATNRKIDTIVIHSTYNITNSDPFDLDAIINKEYKPAGVSPHYIINRDGKIYRLVEDKNIAYHAGESKMPDGRTGVNNFSIGIELVNSKTSKPTDDQYNSLKYLVNYLKGRYSIKYVLGHKDIAAGRKDDPWNFDFSKIK